jgi:hypothetical protein
VQKVGAVVSSEIPCCLFLLWSVLRVSKACRGTNYYYNCYHYYYYYYYYLLFSLFFVVEFVVWTYESLIKKNSINEYTKRAEIFIRGRKFMCDAVKTLELDSNETVGFFGLQILLSVFQVVKQWDRIYNSTNCLHNINTLITYNYILFAATCFDVTTSSSGSSSCLTKITYVVDIDEMELLKYKIWNTKYKITFFHNMLVVYRTTSSLCDCAIYKL